MQVGEQRVGLRVVECVAKGGHHIAAMHNCCVHAVVIGWRAAGQEWLLVECLQAGAMQRTRGVGGVAARAVCLKNRIALRLDWRQLIQWLRRRQMMAARNKNQCDAAKKYKRCDPMSQVFILA